MKKTNTLYIAFLTFLFILFINPTLGNQPIFHTENRIIYDACFSNHGNVLFVADGKKVNAYSFNDRELIREFKDAHHSQIMSLSVSADSNLVASGDRDGKLVLHCMHSGRNLHSFSNHEGIIMSTDISANAKYLASGATDNKVVLYDLSNMSVINEFKVHSDDVLGVKFSPNGRWLVSTGADGNIVVFDIENQTLHRLLENQGFFVRDIDFTPDSQSFITVGDDGSYYTWCISEMGDINLIGSNKGFYHKTISIHHAPFENVFVIASIRGLITVITKFGVISANIRVPVNKALVRISDNQRVEVIAATRGKGIVYLDGADMKYSTHYKEEESESDED